jgi:hypothetical protein
MAAAGGMGAITRSNLMHTQIRILCTCRQMQPALRQASGSQHNAPIRSSSRLRRRRQLELQFRQGPPLLPGGVAGVAEGLAGLRQHIQHTLEAVSTAQEASPLILLCCC